jgi:hypothetical protein
MVFKRYTMKAYFVIRLYAEYIIPFILLILLFFVIAIHIVADKIKEKRIHRFFISHRYKRTLLGVSSVGAKSYYGWIRDYDYKIADDRDIKGWSLKQIKEKYK